MRVAASKARVISAEEAAALVQSNMWLDYGTSLVQPDVFLSEIRAFVQGQAA